MGGAFTLLAALDGRLNRLTDESILVYTYGQPRVGNYEFSQLVDSKIPNLYRVIHHYDVVPHLPPCDYMKGCEKTAGSTTYFHANTEVWYPKPEMKKGDYKMCSFEDHSCSNSISVMDASSTEHKTYFGIRISCEQGSVFSKAVELLSYNHLFTVEELLGH